MGYGTVPRRVSSQGHYVLVAPTPLPEPKLLIHSPAMAEAFGWVGGAGVDWVTPVRETNSKRHAPEKRDSYWKPAFLGRMSVSGSARAIFVLGPGSSLITDHLVLRCPAGTGCKSRLF